MLGKTQGQLVVGLVMIPLMIQLMPGSLYAQDSQRLAPGGFRPVRRSGSVDIGREYSLVDLRIPRDQIHTLLPRDAIPALTDPKLEPAGGAGWLPGRARVITVTVGAETIGVPLRILDWHEVVNMTVGGQPVAVTYCPLCDSAAVFSRRITVPAGNGKTATVVLEFGVSGALFNSNVLMYDRRDKALWSQLGMRAVSGPLAGTALETLPVEVVRFAHFKQAHPDAKIVSRDTGHARDYTRSPYERYFQDDKLMVPVAQVGNALPRKTLGLGVAADTDAWFVPEAAIGDGFTLDTPAGNVRMTRSSAGVAVLDVPKGVRTAQTFYYAWSAFYPQTRVVRSLEDATSAGQDARQSDSSPTRVGHR